MKTNTYIVVTKEGSEEWEVSTDAMAKLKVDTKANRINEDVKLYNSNNELIYVAKPNTK